MTLIKCSECDEFFDSRDINCILGVYVCKNCYPEGIGYNYEGGEFSSSKYAYQFKNPIENCQRDFDYELMMCKDCKDYKKCLKIYGKNRYQKKLF